MSYNVCSCKLSTGEEIIAKIDEGQNFLNQSGIIELKQPFVLIQTQQGIGVMPWINTGSTESVTIKTSHVVTIVKTKSEVEAMYVKATSGIDIATTDASSIIM
jgi:hypothetical protein